MNKLEVFLPVGWCVLILQKSILLHTFQSFNSLLQKVVGLAETETDVIGGLILVGCAVKRAGWDYRNLRDEQRRGLEKMQ